jgi:hypothetical protein
MSVGCYTMSLHKIRLGLLQIFPSFDFQEKKHVSPMLCFSSLLPHFPPSEIECYITDTEKQPVYKNFALLTCITVLDSSRVEKIPLKYTLLLSNLIRFLSYYVTRRIVIADHNYFAIALNFSTA